MPGPDDALPPAQPSYVLRGHQSQIHALAFYAGNRRLLSGDADGFVISWDMVTKRPVAGWKAHGKAVLGVAAWDADDADASVLITHGRDGRLAVWRLDAATERLMHQYVPPDQLQEATAKPAVLQEIEAGAVSFCAFAMCAAPLDMAFAGLSLDDVSKKGGSDDAVGDVKGKAGRKGQGWASRSLLLAVPSPRDSEDVDIFYAPAGTRKSTVKAPKNPRPGMVMAIIMDASMELTLAAGHENGEVYVHQHDVISDTWSIKYKARPHSQPVLSLCLHPELRVCVSSSADATIAKHPFADRSILASSNDTPLKIMQTKHAGQQGLSMRDDGRIYASAGWDSRIRVYSAKTMKELATLKLHRQGCYATALASVKNSNRDSSKVVERAYGNVVLRLDRMNRRYHLRLLNDDPVEHPPSQDEEALWILVNERIAGLKENNPSKLHKALDEYERWAAKLEQFDGKQLSAAADLGLLPSSRNHAQRLLDLLQECDAIKSEHKGADPKAEILVPETPPKSKTMARYEETVRTTHWLAAGSKDGTISLWDVF